ncbi:MAG TPA: DNA-processing protein DprA [Gemmataceae bacterium]|nr:DNA-processing protein DprA [Gemmataceae bacterium]
MASAPLPLESVHPDTQAVLLLCASFARAGQSDVKPLTLREYNTVASWLGRHNRRPASLLHSGEEPFPDGEPGLPAVDRLRTLLDRGFQLAAALEGWQRLGLWVISRGEDRYPERLRRHLRSSSPPLLYGAGDLARLNLGGLAVVGSRNIDAEGRSFTQRVAARCAEQGVPIVSGGAGGVDRAAVEAALEAGGGAVAVLAERLDRAATARESREPLRDGRLTLLAPYEPDSGFTIGKAMGRNKDIYALADYALVVRFKTGEGGTWTGATEQLGRNKSAPPGVSVFVRAAHNPENGVAELRSRGAVLFQEEEFWRCLISEILALPTKPPVPSIDPTCAQPVSETETSEAALPCASTAADTETCYHRCVPLLLQSFQEEINTKQLPEIAKKLQLLPKQLEDWLKRAVEEGKLTKKKKKGRIVYVVPSAGAEPTLFGGDGDAA